MSIEDVAAQLRAVLAAIEQGRQMINHAAVCNDNVPCLTPTIYHHESPHAGAER